MRLVWIAFFAGPVSMVAQAQTPDLFSKCMATADTEVAMRSCADQEAQRADLEMRDAYDRLAAVARNESDAVAKIAAAQKAWIAYRDAYLDAMYPAEDKIPAYGSQYFREFLLARAHLTHLHAAELTQLTKRYLGQ